MEPAGVFTPTLTHPSIIGQGLPQRNAHSQAPLLPLLPGEEAAGPQVLVGMEMVKGWSATQLQKDVARGQGCQGNSIHPLSCGPQALVLQKLWKREEPHPEETCSSPLPCSSQYFWSVFILQDHPGLLANRTCQSIVALKTPGACRIR